MKRFTTLLLLQAFAMLCVAADNNVDASRYQETANKLIDAEALADDQRLNRLEIPVLHRIGNRLSRIVRS